MKRKYFMRQSHEIDVSLRDSHDSETSISWDRHIQDFFRRERDPYQSAWLKGSANISFVEMYFMAGMEAHVILLFILNYYYI